MSPIRLSVVGIVSWNIRIPPRRVNTTSPAWVDSIIAILWELSLTISVALKNNIVAIIPEKTATMNDCINWLFSWKSRIWNS